REESPQLSLAERLAKSERPDRIGEVQTRVQTALVEGLGPKLYDSTMSDAELQRIVHRRITQLLQEEQAPLSAPEKARIMQQTGDSVLGLGPLEPFIRDPDVHEVRANKSPTNNVQRGGKPYSTGAK